MPISSQPGKPMRIASLLPSATEIIRALGLEHSLVAVSHSCNFGGKVERLPRVTRTRVPKDASSRDIDAIVRQCLMEGASLYEIDVETLDALRPDLIVTQGLCKVCAVGEDEVGRVLPALYSQPLILSLAPTTLEGVFESVLEVGRATDSTVAAQSLIASLSRRVERVRERTSGRERRPRVAFLEWTDPLICGGHWNPELVELAGGSDGLGRRGQPSRTVTLDELLAFQPEVLLLAACGLTAARAQEELGELLERPGVADLPCARSGRIYELDGVAHFSRPGPSLVDSLESLATIFD